MVFLLRFGLVAGLILSANSLCLAFQSGSRGAVVPTTAPSASIGSGSRVVTPSLGRPNASSFPLQSRAYQSGQPAIGGVYQEQSPNQFVTPEVTSFDGTRYSTSPMPQSTSQVTSPSNPPPTANGSGGTSPGIPAPTLVDPMFEINDPYSPYTVDHSAWSCLLSRYLVTDATGVNRLRYGAVTTQDHNILKGYLQHLQSVDTRRLNRNEQLAFWFNLYNARTADIVLDNYPIRSIRQVKMKFSDFVGPFDDPGAVTVLGKPLSLNDIESGIVRPVWKDPRIHYALNCASYGCPNLSAQAWTAENLDRRLNSAAYDYINSDRAVRRGVLGVHVAKIFKWYKDDFGGSDQTVLDHLRQYANPCTQQKLQGQQRILGYFYDWSLNDGIITRRRLLEQVIR